MTDQQRLLTWVAAQLGGARVVAHRSLNDRPDASPWLITIASGADVTTDVVLRFGPADDAGAVARFAVEAAALECATANGVPAPRLLGVDADGTASGALALLLEVLPGVTTIPLVATPERLRALGRAAATIHAVTPPGDYGLPQRDRPLADAGLDALPLTADSGAILEAARTAVNTGAMPDDPHVFVHGDLWQGNMLFDGEDYSGVIDWDCAGIGPAGVDLGSLRSDVAIMFGGDAADEILTGWSEVMGGPADSVAWWDVVTGVSTPPDLSLWLPNFHLQGRTDLDLATVTRRRDELVARGLAELGLSPAAPSY